jgi:hypothetical protein
MHRLLTTLTPAQLCAQLGTAHCATWPAMLQPRFVELSASYLQDNAHLFERAGSHLASVRPQYTCFTDDGGVARYLPGLRVRARGLDAELIPAPDLRAACVPAGADARVLDEVQDRILGHHGLWFARHNLGWDLRRSRFGLFGAFSDDERSHMAHAPLAVELRAVDFAGAPRALFERLRDETVAHKQQAGIAVIARDHERLARAYPDELRLCLAQVAGEDLAAMLWTAHGDEAALVEWVGDARFRQDAVAPQVVFAFLLWLQQQGCVRLAAARYEWFLQPVWEQVLRADGRDADLARHHQHTWQRLQARGLQELAP